MNVAAPTWFDNLTDTALDVFSGFDTVVRIHRGVSSVTNVGNARRLELARDLEALIEAGSDQFGAD